MWSLENPCKCWKFHCSPPPPVHKLPRESSAGKCQSLQPEGKHFASASIPILTHFSGPPVKFQTKCRMMLEDGPEYIGEFEAGSFTVIFYSKYQWWAQLTKKLASLTCNPLNKNLSSSNANPLIR